MKTRTRPRTATKTATHRRIVSSASRLMRHRGLTRAGVADVMRGAGLTVGGFYAHFRSKRAMDLEVLERTFDETRERSAARLDGTAGADWLARAVDQYLSAEHRDRPREGCPVPAVVADLTHADKPLRLALGRFFEGWSRRMAAHAPETTTASARERALATIALCVGGLTIARCLRDQPLSDEFLRACRTWALPERRRKRRSKKKRVVADEVFGSARRTRGRPRPTVRDRL
jgi:TetR/AcrR family transcriptional repressor of nem operon